MKLVFTDYKDNSKIFSVDITEDNKIVKRHPTFYRESNQALKQFKLGNTSGLITDNTDITYMRWALVL
jgi:hypothetical protein